ncbi:hypothetical protein MTO96_015995 [Rhipicephalus appendiculatus]
MLRIFVLDLASTLIRCPAGETTFRVSAGLGARGRVGRRPVESRGPDMREADPAEAKAENANSEEFAITKYGEVLQWLLRYWRRELSRDEGLRAVAIKGAWQRGVAAESCHGGHRAACGEHSELSFCSRFNAGSEQTFFTQLAFALTSSPADINLI